MFYVTASHAHGLVTGAYKIKAEMQPRQPSSPPNLPPAQPGAGLRVRRMSIHPRIPLDRVSTYSALTPSPQMVEASTGSRTVEIIVFPGTKWDSTVNRPSSPFTVAFNTCGTGLGGIRCKQFYTFGQTHMATVVENGNQPVTFPKAAATIQLRIVVGYILCSRATSGQFD